MNTRKVRSWVLLSVAVLLVGVLGVNVAWEAEQGSFPLYSPLIDNSLPGDSASFHLNRQTLGEFDSTASLELTLANTVPIDGLLLELDCEPTLRLDSIEAIGRGLAISDFGFNATLPGHAVLLGYDAFGTGIDPDSSAMAVLHFTMLGTDAGDCSHEIAFGETEVAIDGPQLIGHTAEQGLIIDYFVPGDLYKDSFIDALDLAALIDYLFAGADPPCPVVAADVYGCGTPWPPAIDALDLAVLIDHLFAGDPPPCQ